MFKYQSFGHMKSTVSTPELERRWREVRSAMEKEGIDCLFLYGIDAWSGGGVKWFTDLPCDGSLGLVALFPKEGDIALYGHGAHGGAAFPQDSTRGLSLNVGLPISPTLGFTDHFIPEEAVKFFNRFGYKKIGVYRPVLAPYGMVDFVRKNLAGAEIVDATDLVDTIKAIKSEEELEAHKNAIWIHDEIHKNMALWIKPGRTEREVTIDIRKAALDLGCEEMNIMIGGAKGRSYHVPIYLQNEKLESGHNTEIVIEFTASGGYYGELQRIWCVDCEPFPALQRAMDGCYELQAMMAAAAKPGVPCSDMRAIMLRYQEEHGFEKDNRACGHGQGVDLVERPAFFFGETMTFQENMFISIHPPCGERDAYCNACDNFVVTKDGAIRLTQTEQKIFIA